MPGNSQPFERYCRHQARRTSSNCGEHGVAILASLAHLDPDQHALGIDVANAQHDNLAAAQARAVGHAQRGLVLEARARRRLEQPSHILRRENARQLPGVMGASELVREIGAAERDGEEEPQRRGLAVHFGRLGAFCDLLELEPSQIVSRDCLGRAAEKPSKGLDMTDIVVLRLLAELPDSHVLKHAAAQIADGLIAHRRAPGLEVEVLDQPILRTERLPTLEQLLQMVSAASGPGQGSSKLPRERVRCVPSMFESLGVKVPCPT